MQKKEARWKDGKLKEAFVLLVLGFAVMMDFKMGKIKNIVLYSCIMSSFLLQILRGGTPVALLLCIRMMLPILLLYILYKIGALGAGDIKLFSFIFLNERIKEGLWILWMSMLIGSVIGLLKFILNKSGREAIKRAYLYIKTVTTEKRWDPYPVELHDFSACIHFSLAIFLAYLWYIWRW